MDQEMEADEFFPDKLMSEPDVASEWSNDQTIGDDVSKGEGGESALNGDEEVGKGAEEMETDEPVSMLGEDMEMAGESAEPANDLEELAKEVEIPGNGASDSELSLIDDSGEQEVSDKEENTFDSQNVYDDNLDLEAGKPDVDGAGNNIGNDNLDSLEKSNENAIILSESQEISNINESEELNRNDDDVLDLEEPLVEDKNIIDTQDIAEGRGKGEGSTEEISQAQVEDTGDVTQESVSNRQEDNEFGDGVEHIAEDSDSKSNQDASASNLAEENTEQEKEDEDLNEDELLGANEDDKDYQGEEQSVVEAGANSGSVIKDQDESSLDLNQEVENYGSVEVGAGIADFNSAEDLELAQTEAEGKKDSEEIKILEEPEPQLEQMENKDDSLEISDNGNNTALKGDMSHEFEKTDVEENESAAKGEVTSVVDDIAAKGEMDISEMAGNINEVLGEDDKDGLESPVNTEIVENNEGIDAKGDVEVTEEVGDLKGALGDVDKDRLESPVDTEDVEEAEKSDVVKGIDFKEVEETEEAVDINEPAEEDSKGVVEEPVVTGEEAMDTESNVAESKETELENMEVAEMADDAVANEVEETDINKEETAGQESDQATEEVSKEMIPDKANDVEDPSNSEEGETEDEAVHRSSTKSPEQRSNSSEKDLTEVSEIANQSETTPSADNSSQPDNVMQSEATPSADNSNQSEADSQSEVTPSADNSNQSEADSQSEVTPSGDNSNQSAAVSQSETTPPGDNSNQSEAVNQSEVTPSGDNSNQSEGTSNRKSPSFDMSSVKIKKERMDSTESDKANESENSNTGSSNLKIVGVTSAVGVEDKGDHSEQTSENASAKGDNAEEKKTTKNNEVNEQVKVKQESLAAATATEKEDIKKIVNEELKKKIKQESKAKEDEDDDVIAIKEEKKPVPKPKPSKIQTCIVCGKVGKCKYNIVRNGDVKHLCDDTCFKRFRSSPTTYLKQAEGISQAQSKPDQQTNSKPAPTPLKNTAPVKAVPNQQASFQQQSQVYKTCTVCQLMNVRTSKPFLNWQGLDFCGEECLGKYQGGLSNNCSYCSGAIFPNNKAKFCCRVGNEVKHFCSTNCNNDYVKRMKLCAFCNKDLAQSTDSFMAPVGETFKDFCSQTCLQKFEEKNNKDVEIVGVQKGQKASKAPKGNFICAVCGKVGPVKHEFKLDSKVNRLCSDPCFSAFQYANKLTLNTCDNCGTNLNSENQAPQYVQFEGQQRRFCSFMCVNTFRNTNKKTVPCAWCGNKKSNFDMIERVDANNKYQLFCSLNCLSLYRVNLQATSNQAVTCDQCRKFVPAQYHLTMSDASVRNFCSYGCVMQFQAQFQAPAKQVPHQNSVNNAVNAGKGVSPAQQQQQQTTTRSGRVVTKAPKVAAAAQQQPAGKARATKKDGDSFPIISNVVSLAPQGTQQQINIKSSTPVTVTNQQQGIKATTTTTGNQTVQQQIIIQPPPPISVKNKSLLCKPFTQTKATSCRPHTQIKEVQTEGKSEPEKYLIPVPVPVYCPTPLAMYSVPVPVPFPVPVPIPVPVFIPTTKKSANSILKQIKEIREKIPADPLEAELLMMAEAVAGKDEESSSSSEEEDNTAPPVKETSTAPAASSSGGGDLGEDMLQMALRMASEMTDEPVMDLENSLEPVAVNTEPPAQPKPVVPPPQPVEEDDEYMPSSARSRRSRGGNKRQSRSTPRRNPKRQKVEITPQYHEATPSPPAPAAPPPDANFHLKYTYGVNAFKHWVIQKNSQIEQASKPGHGKNLKTFKTDILQCTADELNYSLCLFVKEVRKPNGEEYAVDSIYYLCLGIQQYLFENGRIDNIFTDFYYERFTEGLNEILTRYEPKLNHAGQLVCRIEEEHLWESKQLGAHSPHVLLNSLVYFNTKYFMLKTSEDHLKLSFTHIMKHWKKTATGRGSGTGPNAGRSVYLRYYCPTPQGKADNQKKKKEEMPVYEQTENLDNPLRCPVKLYEFYLSKCPESIKNRNDTFYLKPERSSVPDSPVWYSNQSINIDHLTKLLNRIRLVREIQEAHLHTQPIYI